MAQYPQIILFTSGFPYGYGESFLENEIIYLANTFERVIIVPKNPNIEQEQRSLPGNCSVEILNFTKKKLGVLSYLFQKGVLQEIFRVLFSQNGIDKFKIILGQIFIAYHTIRKLQEITEYNSKQIIYSYWTDDSAIAMGLIKPQYPHSLFISRAHGWDVYFERDTSNYLPLRPFLSENLDNIFFISQNGLDYFRSISGVNPKFGKVSRLGTINSAAKLNEQKETSRLNIVSCSSIIPLKRVHLIIEALSLADFPFHWYHIGNGSLQKSLNDQAEKSLPIAHFSFLGQMKNSEVMEFYRTNKIDLFVNVSSSEGIPVSMMEAQSFGIPCMGTEVGGVAEIINHAQNGYLLPANPTAEDICKLLKAHWLLSKETQTKMRQVTIQFWREHYNAEKNYKRFIEEINS
tara:strand:+ start:326 stop:1537 length:1212 start_codon:yes stop_codon:yes gene_type:complete